MGFPFYFPKPWRPPWFGGYEGCGLQGCFTHWLWKFFEIKKRLVDYCAAKAALDLIRGQSRAGCWRLSVLHSLVAGGSIARLTNFRCLTRSLPS